MGYKYFIYLVILTLFISCQKTQIIMVENPKNRVSTKEQAKKELAKALYQASSDYTELLAFFKEKSIENEKDNIFQLEYNNIKDLKVLQATTFRQLLIRYIGSEAVLKEVEFQLPELAFFIPSFPENEDFFHINTWNVSEKAMIWYINKEKYCTYDGQHGGDTNSGYITNRAVILILENKI